MDSRCLTPSPCGSSSLSIMQHCLLNLVRLNPAAPIHTTVALELIGRLSRHALRAALDHILYRHQILRTVFRQVDVVSVPLVGPPDRGLVLLDQDVGTEHEVLCLLRDETRVLFDVSSGPLIRARLLQLTPSHHFLLISAHPLVCDCASKYMILNELRNLYCVFSQAKANIMAPATQYADYVLHQFKTSTPRVLQEQLSYWKRQLLGAQDLARLPTDRPRPAIQRYSTQTHRFDLSEELTAKVDQLAERRGVSILAVLLGGWSVLLNRWSGQRDLTIGVLLSNRPLGWTGYLIGPFENTLPIRVGISPSTTVSALLAQVDSTLSAAALNQDVPIHAVSEALRTLRGGRPIIQTAISLSQSLDTAAGDAFASGELAVTRVWEERCESPLEIAISLSQAGGKLVAIVEYAQELFEKHTIERVSEWWISLFSAMVKAPGSKVSRLPMLTAAGRTSVISEFNNGCFSCMPQHRIDEVFESYVELTPDALAMVEGDRALSFLELNERANQLAHILKRRGARSGELIAVPSRPSIEAVVAAIAVLKAGGAYIAGTPAELRNGALRTRGAQASRMFIVATQAEIASRLIDEQIIAFDADAEAISRESVDNLHRSDANACDLACAIWSTAHTGEPRWILLEHRNVTSMMSSLDERLHFTRLDVWSLAHSMSSGVALMELWGALLSGSQVSVVPAGVTKDPEGLSCFLAQGGITVLNQKPSEFLPSVDMIKLTSRHRLHTLILSGEPLRAAALKTWFDVGRRWPQIIYLYGHRGPTVAVAYSKVTQIDALRRSGSGLAGVPLSFCRLYILDRYRQPVPIGVVGDIYVAGDSVARGYIENRQHYEGVPDPFGDDPSSKLYKTGDLGYWTPAGQVELPFPRAAATNLDVEAMRIESELLAHPAVRHASVVVSPHEAGGDSLVAYVEGLRSTPSPAELRAYLELSVPAYMVPKEFLCQAKRGPKI